MQEQEADKERKRLEYEKSLTGVAAHAAFFMNKQNADAKVCASTPCDSLVLPTLNSLACTLRTKIHGDVMCVDIYRTVISRSHLSKK